MRVQERGVGRSEVGKQRVKVRREGSREGRVGEMHGLLSIDDVGSWMCGIKKSRFNP